MVSTADALIKQIDGVFRGREQKQSSGREYHPHLNPLPLACWSHTASRSRERRLPRFARNDTPSCLCEARQCRSNLIPQTLPRAVHPEQNRDSSPSAQNDKRRRARNDVTVEGEDAYVGHSRILFTASLWSSPVTALRIENGV
jgi:hypothetical protein